MSPAQLAKIDAIGLNIRYNDVSLTPPEAHADLMRANQMKGKFGYVTFQEEKDEQTMKEEIWSDEFPQADARKRGQ